MTEDVNWIQSDGPIVEMTIDHERAIGRIVLDTGHSIEFPIDPPPAGESAVNRASYLPHAGILRMLLTNGAEVSAELDLLDTATARRGRPVIYLDQGHWSTLANVSYNPKRVSKRDIKPAIRLLELANQKEIILPISSAHMIETGATYATKRQNLASTMLEASHGWIMRDPLDVRQSELVSTFLKRYRKVEPNPASIFTLDHSLLYARDATRGHRYSPRGKSPAIVRALTQKLVEVLSTYDTLADPRRIDGESDSSKWAEHHRNLAQEMARNKERPEKRRTLGILAATIDVQREIAFAATTAGVSTDQLKEWYELYREHDLTQMPFLGLYADSVAFRLANAQRKWSGNDLIDGLFLCCATAYADAVAGERGATEYIKRSWGWRSDAAPIFATLPELLPYIEENLLPATGKPENVEQD
ncbi:MULTISPECIES: hypothetical protein [Saccharothrix]|uniref:hypothetical protein n=1 Tax=Saccharothrix TaxID=2071 RepID=UPI0011610929|nr:hypothetical protein [Saccharothrix sp. CB00851]